MSLTQRIANLAAYLSADTRDYEEGMKRAARTTRDTEIGINRSMGLLEKTGLKLGLGLVGSGGALALLTGEIRNVIENIEKIPGIPATTIASIQQTRFAFQEARTGVDQAIAGVVSFTAWSARAAGFIGGALVYGLDAAEQGYWDFARAADNAASAQERQAAAAKKAAEENAAATRILAYATDLQNKKINDSQAAIEHNARAKEAYDRRNETQLERMNRLQREADDVFNHIQPGQGGASGVEAQAKAYEKLTESAKIRRDLEGEANKHLEFWAKFMDGNYGFEIDPFADTQRHATEAERAALAFADSLNRAFEESIIEGQRLSDVMSNLARSILSTFLKLAVVNPLMNKIFGKSTGWSVLPSLFGGGKAAGGPVSGGTSYLVGEQGPEIFTPSGGGKITPNHEMRGGGGTTYYIDARGADRTGLARLEAMIRETQGSIQPLALAAVMDFKRRGITS